MTYYDIVNTLELLQIFMHIETKTTKTTISECLF